MAIVKEANKTYNQENKTLGIYFKKFQKLIKDVKKLPPLGRKESFINLFGQVLYENVQHTLRQSVETISPEQYKLDISVALNNIVRLLSYNAEIRAFIGGAKWKPLLLSLKLHLMVLDFKQKLFTGSLGEEIHHASLIIISTAVREEYQNDTGSLVVISRDDLLIEAQVRLQKAEIKHIWHHFNEVLDNQMETVVDLVRSTNVNDIKKLKDEIDDRLFKLQSAVVDINNDKIEGFRKGFHVEMLNVIETFKRD